MFGLSEAEPKMGKGVEGLMELCAALDGRRELGQAIRGVLSVAMSGAASLSRRRKPKAIVARVAGWQLCGS